MSSDQGRVWYRLQDDARHLGILRVHLPPACQRGRDDTGRGRVSQPHSTNCQITREAMTYLTPEFTTYWIAKFSQHYKCNRNSILVETNCIMYLFTLIFIQYTSNTLGHLKWPKNSEQLTRESIDMAKVFFNRGGGYKVDGKNLGYFRYI